VEYQSKRVSTSASIAFAFILVAIFLHVLFVSKEDVKCLE